MCLLTIFQWNQIKLEFQFYWFHSQNYFFFVFLSCLSNPQFKANYYHYYYLLIRGFHISISWWSFTGDWVTASLLKSPGLFLVFWSFSIMLLFGWSPLGCQLPNSPGPSITVPKAPITIGIIVTFMFHSFFNSLARSSVIIIIIIILLSYSLQVFPTSVTCWFSLESEWQQVSSGLYDSSQYSGQSQQCCLDSLESSADFQLFQPSFQALATVPSALITTGITVTLVLYSFLSSLAISKYLSSKGTHYNWNHR